MDSPEPSKTTATPTSAAAASSSSSSSVSESAAVQESPFSNYLSNLSPIGPVKTAIVVQDFPGIITPPHVFTSPRINPRIVSSLLERGPFLQLPNEEFSVKDDSQNSISTLRDRAGSSNTQLNSGFVPHTDKVSDNNSPVQEQAESQPICVDDFLVDAAKLGSVDSKNSSLQQADGLIGSKESVDLKGEEIKNNNEMATGDINSKKTSGKKRVDDAESVPSSKMQPDSSSKMQPDSSLENQYDHRGTSEAGEHQRGVFRRCLQFEDVQLKTALTPDPCNLSESVNCSNSAVSPIALESFPLNTPTPQSSRQFGDTQNTENSSFKTPKPSGIGLHLNSIVSTVQGGSVATVSMKSAERGNFSVQGKKLMSMTSHLEKSKKCLISSNVGEDILASIEESSLQGESSTPLPLHSVKPIDSIASLKPMKCLSTPGNKRKSSSENIDGTVASNQSSPKKKRKKTSDASDGDGCKRCNCKRSKCLKLYCDCFAAGIYCAEPCACQGCFNRPEYEDTVLETRQQIESRNPLAFAPKVVQHMTDSHSNIVGDNGVSFTPSSARHKRGCNCKRSMCLKKYCECYQANVGCSSGCRCEGCKNVYGQKEEYGRIKTLVKKLGTFEQTELSNPHNLTPLTPSFQCSDHRNDASKSWFTSGRCSQSPESGHTLIPRYEVSKKGFTKSSDNPESIEETTDIMDLVSFDPEVEDNNSAAVNEYSPGEMNQLVVLPNSQQWVNDSREHLYAGTCHLSSTSSFGWRSSPMTPMTQYDGSKEFYESINSDKSSFNAIEDDTPEILKDASTPPGGVKVSSPNKKRVSPPHGRLKDPDGSSSARRLKAGRKYKLGSVPSFPPLTPCFVSKGSSEGQIKNDPQKPSSST